MLMMQYPTPGRMLNTSPDRILSKVIHWRIKTRSSKKYLVSVSFQGLLNHQHFCSCYQSALTPQNIYSAVYATSDYTDLFQLLVHETGVAAR